MRKSGKWRIREVVSRLSRRGSGPTVRQWCSRLLGELARQHCRSWYDYQTLVRHYLGPLESTKVSMLATEDITEWLSWLERQKVKRGRRKGQQLTGASRTKLLYNLSTFLERAEERKLLKANPVRGLKKKSRPGKKRINQAQRQREALPETIFRALILDIRIPVLHRFAWCGALMTGTRSGELIGFQVGDYQRRQPEQTERLGALNLERQWSQKRRTLDATKTGHSRAIPVHLALEAFIEWRLANYPADPTAPLFLFKEMQRDKRTILKRWSQRTILRLWHEDLELLGVLANPPQRFHAARHTMVSVAGSKQPGVDRSIEAITHSAEPKSAFEMYLHFDWAALCRAISLLPVTPEEIRASLKGSKE